MMLRKQRQQEEEMNEGNEWGRDIQHGWSHLLKQLKVVKWNIWTYKANPALLHYCLEELWERWDTSSEKKNFKKWSNRNHVWICKAHMQVWFKTFQKCLDFEPRALSQFTTKKNDVEWRGRRKTESYWWKVDIAQLNQCISPEIPVWLFRDRT